jgi:hypothetical protein
VAIVGLSPIADGLLTLYIQKVPAIDLRAEILDPALDLRVPGLHALNHCGLLLDGQIPEVEVLTGTNANSGKFYADRHFILCELQGQSRYLKKPVFARSVLILGEFDRRCSRRRRLLEKAWSWLSLVARLDIWGS